MAHKIGHADDGHRASLVSTAHVNRNNELKISSMQGAVPDWMMTNLRKLDIDGSGTIAEDEMAEMCSDIRQLKLNQQNNSADIDYRMFPHAAQEVFKGWDEDNSGTVSVTELEMAAEAQRQLMKENRNAKLALGVLTVACFMLVLCFFGVAVGANELTKTEKVDGAQLTSKTSGGVASTQENVATAGILNPSGSDVESESRRLAAEGEVCGNFDLACRIAKYQNKRRGLQAKEDYEAMTQDQLIDEAVTELLDIQSGIELSLPSEVLQEVIDPAGSQHLDLQYGGANVRGVRHASYEIQAPDADGNMVNVEGIILRLDNVENTGLNCAFIGAKSATCSVEPLEVVNPVRPYDETEHLTEEEEMDLEDSMTPEDFAAFQDQLDETDGDTTMEEKREQLKEVGVDEDVIDLLADGAVQAVHEIFSAGNLEDLEEDAQSRQLVEEDRQLRRRRRRSRPRTPRGGWCSWNRRGPPSCNCNQRGWRRCGYCRGECRKDKARKLAQWERSQGGAAKALADRQAAAAAAQRAAAAARAAAAKQAQINNAEKAKRQGLGAAKIKQDYLATAKQNAINLMKARKTCETTLGVLALNHRRVPMGNLVTDFLTKTLAGQASESEVCKLILEALAEKMKQDKEKEASMATNNIKKNNCGRTTHTSSGPYYGCVMATVVLNPTVTRAGYKIALKDFTSDFQGVITYWHKYWKARAVKARQVAQNIGACLSPCAYGGYPGEWCTMCETQCGRGVFNGRLCSFCGEVNLVPYPGNVEVDGSPCRRTATTTSTIAPKLNADGSSILVKPHNPCVASAGVIPNSYCTSCANDGSQAICKQYGYGCDHNWCQYKDTACTKRLTLGDGSVKYWHALSATCEAEVTGKVKPYTANTLAEVYNPPPRAGGYASFDNLVGSFTSSNSASTTPAPVQAWRTTPSPCALMEISESICTKCRNLGSNDVNDLDCTAHTLDGWPWCEHDNSC